ncbi:MAG: VWA domain-containing protein [Clostridiales bacterium]|nr:VWA domain-containing protein [Clostridiales bacterium]
MIFSQPLGFLGLLLIPVIILIYIIKNTYTEQTVPSTYIWTLSEKFIKKRNPINKLVGIISLILQIVLVTIISLAIVHPTLVLRNAAHDYCFVLDASGSMSAVEEGSTRFDIAKNNIADLIDDSVDGSSYTLIYAGLTTESVYEKLTDKDTALYLLDECVPDYSSTSPLQALGLVQKHFNNNSALKVYLFTDEDYQVSDNVQVINVGHEVQNCALSDVEYGFTASELTVKGTVTNYNTNKSVNVALYINGESQPCSTQNIQLGTGEQVQFSLKSDDISFEQFRVAILEDDDMPLDNEVVVYNFNQEKASATLIVSENASIYIKAALLAAGMTNVDTATLDEYSNTSGYGLYIFDSVLPLKLPDDGAVWFVNPQGSVPGANFNYQGVAMDRSFTAEYSTSTSSVITGLLEGVTTREFDLKQYVKCGLSGRFSTLVSCEGNPLVFAGSNAYGNREVVFAFDLRDATAFTLSDSYTMLVYNLLNYSFPSIIDKTTYFSGDIVQINLLSGVESVKIETPSEKEVYPDSATDISEYQINEVGVYTVILTMKNKTEYRVHFFAAVPIEERTASGESHSFELVGVATNDGFNGYYDMLFALIIALLVVAIADFGVYCYEQYQLR